MHAMKIDRVILATNLNEKYIQFWPIVAQAWQEIVGVRPTLILVAPRTVYVDESFGDVIYFEPVPGLPTSYQAQVIRLFAPVLFPDDVCILGDIDMLPLQKEFFDDGVAGYEPDKFVVFRKYEHGQRYPMCYVAGQGATFKEIFNINWIDVPRFLSEWFKYGYGWNTDELMMAKMIHDWSECKEKVVFLNDKSNNRITRLFWGYEESLLKDKKYLDAHLMRPYVEHRHEIDLMLSMLGLPSKIDRLNPCSFKKELIGDNNSKSVTQHIFSALLLDEVSLVASINIEENHLGLSNVKTYSTVSEFISRPSKSFIDLLMINFSTIKSKDVEKLQQWCKYHQIQAIYLNFTNLSLEAKIATRSCYRLLSEAGYVLFKITAEGLMHVPTRSVLGSHYYKGDYIAFAPQYARGWASIQDK